MSGIQNIKYVIVLMMENRSFDHMLGYSNITGQIPHAGTGSINGITTPFTNPVPSGGTYATNSSATPESSVNPGHEFGDVLVQLTGNVNYLHGLYTGGAYPTNLNNQGFIIDNAAQSPAPTNPNQIMNCFAPSNLPVLVGLASNFVVCDNWFSSMPGPTWPNRFFVHAATSGGLDDSPVLTDSFIPSVVESDGFQFKNGTIYDKLTAKGVSWHIYSDSVTPLVAALKGVKLSDISSYSDFSTDITSGTFPSYCFIEPNYGDFITGTYKGGNSEHPIDSVAAGETFMKGVYDTIVGSPIWQNCMFIITYDEHGGFFDHVAPPSTVAPDGDLTYSLHNFDFRTLGCRVPGIIISPWIDANQIDHTLYDHTSILATVEQIFNIQPLTARDTNANSFVHLVTRTTPLPTPVIPAANSPNTVIYPTVDPQSQLDRATGEHVLLTALAQTQFSHADTLTQLSNIKVRGDATNYLNQFQTESTSVSFKTKLIACITVVTSVISLVGIFAYQLF